MQATVRGKTLPVFKQWLKVASSKGNTIFYSRSVFKFKAHKLFVYFICIERDVILKMLQAGYNDCEEVRLGKAIGEVLKPDAISNVQEWLKTASESGEQKIISKRLQ